MCGVLSDKYSIILNLYIYGPKAWILVIIIILKSSNCLFRPD